MSNYRVIQAFQDRTVLPIDLDEVAKWIVDQGIQNEINFIGVELEPYEVLRGYIKRFKFHKGGWDPEPDLISNIYYETRQGPDWQHMTCAKELLHIMDAACVTSKEQFDKLTHRLSLSNDVRHLLEDPDFAFVDKLGTAPASALLLPMAARELLMPAYKANVLQPADIAKIAVMPVEHVRTVMSDDWPTIHALIEGNKIC